MINIINSAEKVYFSDPIKGVNFTYQHLYNFAHSIHLELISKSAGGKNVLLLLKEHDNYLPALIACWLSNITPAVYTPNASSNDYESLVRQFDFSFIVTDFKLVIESVRSVDIAQLERPSEFEEKDKLCQIEFEDNRIALILFSSGTSGEQKCIPLSFSNIRNNVLGFTERLGINSSSTFICGSPLWHAHGLYNSFLTGLFLDASIIYTGPLSLLNIKALFHRAKLDQNLVFHITPSMIPILLMYAKKVDRAQLPQINNIICGTSFLDLTAKAQLESIYDVSLIQQYGMTETLFMTVNESSSKSKPKSVGKAIKGTLIEIVKDGIVLEPMLNGSIRVQSNSCFGNYFGGGKHNKAFSNNYFYTGDIGYLDNEGYLFISGREKDLIKKGGFSIAANTITELIYKIPDINDAFTVGVNDQSLGEEIYCFYTSNVEKSETEIKAYLKTHLQHQFVPKKIFKIREFPKTDTGKIIKSKVLELLDSLI